MHTIKYFFYYDIGTNVISLEIVLVYESTQDIFFSFNIIYSLFKD